MGENNVTRIYSVFSPIPLTSFAIHLEREEKRTGMEEMGRDEEGSLTWRWK